MSYYASFMFLFSEFESVITELRGDNQEMQKQIRSQTENEANLSRQRQSAVGELSEQVMGIFLLNSHFSLLCFVFSISALAHGLYCPAFSLSIWVCVP